jgi:hypothetical protein
VPQLASSLLEETQVGTPTANKATHRSFPSAGTSCNSRNSQFSEAWLAPPVGFTPVPAATKPYDWDPVTGLSRRFQPGKPRDPNESGLEELLARAEPFR